MSAELARVREQVWCLVDEELETGVRSIAVPARDSGSQVIAAINTSAHAMRTTTKVMKTDLLPMLLACAENINRGLASRWRASPR